MVMGGGVAGPRATVDVIIELERPGEAPGIVLIERRFPPLGWALPGGFVDPGEAVHVAARREAREETALEVELTELFHVYSDPRRDARLHTISTVFLARAHGVPRAGDDAGRAEVFAAADLPAALCFDHGVILADYRRYRTDGTRPPVTR